MPPRAVRPLTRPTTGGLTNDERARGWHVQFRVSSATMSSMSKATNHAWLAVCLLAMTAGAAAAPAPVPATSAKQATAEKQSRPATLQQAVEQAQRQTHGRVLAADTIRSRHGHKYRIKVLTGQGRVRIIEMNSAAVPKPDAKGEKHDNKEKR